MDPLSAGALGVLFLGETLNLTPAHLCFAAVGVTATVVGVVLLSRPQPSAPTTPRIPQLPHATTIARLPAPRPAARVAPEHVPAETAIDQPDR